MIDARLITFREFEPWTESLIRQMPRPPRWILELTTTKYQPDAVRIVREFAHCEPFESLGEAEWVDDYLAALYLRYERQELSWATLLQMAGDAADAYSGKHPCEFYYGMLNEYERSEFSPFVESEQVRVFLSDQQSAIASVTKTFEAIKRFSRQRDGITNE